MILDLFTVALCLVGIWLLFAWFRNQDDTEAMRRHPASAPCSLCAGRGMPDEHPIRLHGPSYNLCRECSIRVDEDCWDAHWRLAHGPRPNSPEDSTEWKR